MKHSIWAVVCVCAISASSCFDHGGGAIYYSDFTGASAQIEAGETTGAAIPEYRTQHARLAKESSVAAALIDPKCPNFEINGNGVHIESLRVSSGRYRGAGTTGAGFYLRNESDASVFVPAANALMESNTGRSTNCRFEIVRGPKRYANYTRNADDTLHVEYLNPDMPRVVGRDQRLDEALPAEWIDHIAIPAHSGAIISMVFLDRAAEMGTISLSVSDGTRTSGFRFHFQHNGRRAP